MDLLEQLINAFGVSGNEEEVRKMIIKEIKNYVHSIHIDKLGNLIAYKRGKPPRVMLAAHMDEIGLIVKNVESHGKIFFSVIGGIDPISLIGQRVSIKTNFAPIYGVITTNDLSNSFSINTIPKINELFVDAGLTQKEIIKRGVRTGDYIFFKRRMINLGNKDILSGKALDDRIGCYILVELAKRLKKTKDEIYFTFTVQEEIGLYGSKTSAYAIKPDWAIAVDVTNADDFDENATIKMGQGPCITIKDAEMVSNRVIDDHLRKLAKNNRIPLQLDVSDFGTTDALSISISHGGVPSTSVTVPVRNLHTTIGMASRKDIENAIKLLELLLKNPPKIKSEEL